METNNWLTTKHFFRKNKKTHTKKKIQLKYKCLQDPTTRHPWGTGAVLPLILRTRGDFYWTLTRLPAVVNLTLWWQINQAIRRTAIMFLIYKMSENLKLMKITSLLVLDEFRMSLAKWKENMSTEGQSRANPANHVVIFVVFPLFLPSIFGLQPCPGLFRLRDWCPTIHWPEALLCRTAEAETSKIFAWRSLIITTSTLMSLQLALI